MIKRIIDISNPAYLSLKNKQLVIKQEEKISKVPIEDISTIILDGHGITISQSLLTACADNNTLVVLCDGKHLPSSVLVPLQGHSIQTKSLAIQCNTTRPIKKKVWQLIIKAKIKAQARVLESVHADYKYLSNLVAKVRSGDPDNVEASAARYYWARLFDDSFRRGDDTNSINHILNYGYSIMRSACARAIVGTGLNPSIGIHHHNQYDAFCLADDLVEPLRPIVDIKVYEIVESKEENLEINSNTKRAILESLSMQCEIDNRKLPLMVALHSYASSIKDAMAGTISKIKIPTI